MRRYEETESVPLFQPFDPAQPAAITGHHLPHWTQPGCTYFVTFRLHDSLPRAFAKRWYAERREWLRQRGVDVDAEAGWSRKLGRLTEADRKEFHERFSSVMECKLDELHGACLLKDTAYRELVEQALRYFHNQRYRLGRYAVLPNHLVLETPRANVSAFVQSLNTAYAAYYNRRHRRRGHLTQGRFHAKLVEGGGAPLYRTMTGFYWQASGRARDRIIIANIGGPSTSSG